MNPTAPAQTALAVPFREALRFWLQLGFISFGGPAGQIAIMHRELVERRGWVSEKRFLHALNFCMVLPGPEAQQLATYLGWLMHKTRGGIAAGLLFVLPSLLMLIALSWVYMAWGTQPDDLVHLALAVDAHLQHAHRFEHGRHLAFVNAVLVMLIDMAGRIFSIFPLGLGVGNQCRRGHGRLDRSFRAWRGHDVASGWLLNRRHNWQGSLFVGAGAHSHQQADQQQTHNIDVLHGTFLAPSWAIVTLQQRR